jgi:hypothetical protein
MDIFQKKKWIPKSEVHGLFTSKLTATHYSYLALKRIPEGGSPLLCWHSYSYMARTTSDDAVHLDLFMSECQFYIMMLSEKKLIHRVCDYDLLQWVKN